MARAALLLTTAVALAGSAAMSGCSSSTGNEPSYSQVAVGFSTLCGVREGSIVDCTGDEAFLKELETAYVLDGTVDKLAVGGTHFCALMLDGDIECRGENFEGSLDLPLAPPYRDVAANFRSTCVIDGNGKPACVGSSTGGTLPPVDEEFVLIDAGTSFACGLTDMGLLHCWGESMEARIRPPEGVFLDFSLDGTACGVSETGSLECWADGSTWVPPAGEFQSVALGGVHVCGVDTAGAVQCASSFEESVIIFDARQKYAQVSVGNTFACALRPSGKVDCVTETNFDDSTTPQLPPA